MVYVKYQLLCKQEISAWAFVQSTIYVNIVQSKVLLVVMYYTFHTMQLKIHVMYFLKQVTTICLTLWLVERSNTSNLKHLLSQCDRCKHVTSGDIC